MKKSIAYLIVSLIGIGCVIFACKKESKNNLPSKTETIARTDSSKVFGNLTPTSVSIKNDRADVFFVQTPVVFTLDLREPGSKRSLGLINTAIKNEIPVAVSVYKNGILNSKIEIAGIEAATPEAVDRFKADYTPKRPLVTKEDDIPPMPDEATMNLIYTACATDPVQTFAFKSDGCYARAHEMARIIELNGYGCGKLFIYAASAASPLAVNVSSSCCQQWSFHVAPLVRFKTASGTYEVRVFDPSIFSTPVTKDQWFNACKSSCTPGANIGATFLAQPYVYNRTASGLIARDVNYSKTNCTLNAYAGLSGGCSIPPAGACSW
jgi:hypothetical protein